MKAALLYREGERELPYREALAVVGIESVAFTPGCGETLDRVGGVLMTGGTDVDPELYKQARHEKTEPADRERDDYESAVMREALARGLPVLAICRGMQLMNVAFGGTLYQHLESHPHEDHDVDLAPPLRSILHSSRMTVNSRHHQAVAKVGAGLIVTARNSSDGLVEGLALPGYRFAIGVQWHPEDLVEDAAHRRLFEGFRKAF